MEFLYKIFIVLMAHMAYHVKTTSHINKEIFLQVGLSHWNTKEKLIDSQGRCQGYVRFWSTYRILLATGISWVHIGSMLLRHSLSVVSAFESILKRLPLDKVMIQLIVDTGKLHSHLTICIVACVCHSSFLIHFLCI